MKRLAISVAIGSLMTVMLPLCWAATNLNSSKSNIYKVTYDTAVVSDAQATALLAELDKMGPADEATLKKWLPANFRRFGIHSDHIKTISVLSARQITCSDCVETCKGKCVKSPRGDCFCYEPLRTSAQLRRVDKASPILILLLADPKDEGQALAVSDEGAPGKKGAKKN
jgi:hypothetical protein